MKRKIGEREICERCGQDIEWWPGGWRDRGNNRSCPSYRGKDGEIITPKNKKHRPKNGRE